MFYVAYSVLCAGAIPIDGRAKRVIESPIRERSLVRLSVSEERV